MLRNYLNRIEHITRRRQEKRSQSDVRKEAHSHHKLNNTKERIPCEKEDDKPTFHSINLYDERVDRGEEYNRNKI